MPHALAGTGSVEELGDLDPDPILVAVDDEEPVVVMRHLQDDRADVGEAAVELVLALIAVRPVAVGIHEADAGGRAAQGHLEVGAAGAGSEVPVEVLHSLFVADVAVWRYGSLRSAWLGGCGGVA